MQTKKAYLVLGAESTGTRWMRDILISAGCLCNYDYATHWQEWDETPPTTQTPVVWHRSYPHGLQYPSIRDMTKHLATYHIQAVVMVRDWYCVYRSQSRFQSEPVIWQNLRRAYPEILTELNLLGIPYFIETYGSLVMNYELHTRWLLKQLGLPDDRPLPPVHDGNAKYYQGV